MVEPFSFKVGKCNLPFNNFFLRRASEMPPDNIFVWGDDMKRALPLSSQRGIIAYSIIMCWQRPVPPPRKESLMTVRRSAIAVKKGAHPLTRDMSEISGCCFPRGITVIVCNQGPRWVSPWHNGLSNCGRSIKNLVKLIHSLQCFSRSYLLYDLSSFICLIHVSGHVKSFISTVSGNSLDKNIIIYTFTLIIKSFKTLGHLFKVDL